MTMLDRLYRSSEKDLVSGDAFIRRFTYQLVGTPAAATAITITDSANVVPNDTVRVITQVALFWIPGAAQFGFKANVNVAETGSGSAGVLVFSPQQQVAGQDQAWCQSGIELYMFPGDFFLVTGNFNAGVAANNISFFAQGLEFPRGTFRR